MALEGLGDLSEAVLLTMSFPTESKPSMVVDGSPYLKRSTPPASPTSGQRRLSSSCSHCTPPAGCKITNLNSVPQLTLSDVSDSHFGNFSLVVVNRTALHGFQAPSSSQAPMTAAFSPGLV
eukprot:CAMPEP_0115191080 /NCGR_PEP_ID=MMETSP0270-20121206/12351_1 /TAXON_ID=71861 /ORGANISM="Scrippsiella trochoidea, Strain CCMP3099" /LENGTH=120 /DNA_ID=CAMNT_0002604301 /DNA_START=360 /DNA_END=719 /DNA_ORIENTATION=+